MRWMVTGAAGALGTDLVRLLDPAANPGDSLVARTRAELDVADGAAVRAAVRAWADTPGDGQAVLLNAAAMTAVDLAETDADARAAAWVVNGEAPGHLAAACAEVGARIVHVSTDYVFAGDAVSPLEPTDPTDPRTVYGRTKLAGEQAVRAALPAGHHIVRTAWVYGDTGTNFVRTIARLAHARDTLDVVDDQRGSPTWSADLAAGLVALGRSSVPAGTLHAAGGGATTWYGLARGVLEELGADPARLRPCGTDRFPRPARRPSYSVLSDVAWRDAGLTPLPQWRGALSAAIARYPVLLEG